MKQQVLLELFLQLKAHEGLHTKRMLLEFSTQRKQIKKPNCKLSYLKLEENNYLKFA